MTCIAVLGVWGAVRDLRRERKSLLQAEIAEIQSHAERTVRHIERSLVEGHVTPDFTELQDQPWLSAHWNTDIVPEEKWAYAAVEDAGQTIVAHSSPALRGGRLPSNWYQRLMAIAGSDAVETGVPELTGGETVFDVRLPITFNGRAVGVYHAALSGKWFEAALAAEEKFTLFGWAVVVGGVVLVVLVATASLYVITRKAAALQRRLDLADVRRITELSQLIVGLAHEVRNPLNAIRLNLHAIDRVQRGEAHLPDDQLSSVVRESVCEIGRVSALIGEMLGYARSEPQREEEVDLNAEVRRALDLVKHVMEDQHVAVVARLAAEPCYARIDRARLRQILLNLLNNAREAVGKGGRIEIAVSRSARSVELVVSDNGPGVPPAHRHRIFEPFYSTKDVGIGLGLALVKKFLDEGGGSIAYDASRGAGGCFVVRLPEINTAVKVEAIQ
ncbi:MAG TPA: HAMP domain-containing sensor histidine kinase [Pirellulales bacterium]|nr:HAMP domain-containing sensor histidine kinase [Pirellulales bacterium]